MSEEEKRNVKDYLPKRNPDPSLWNKVQQLSKNDEEKIEAVTIIFQEQYKLPKENIELIKELANEDQPKKVRVYIAKNLEKYNNIPYGMYTDLFEILSNDSDSDVKKLLENTELYRMTESLTKAFSKILPESLSTSLNVLSKKQERLTQALKPLSKIQTSKIAEQVSQMLKTLETLNLDKITIPKISFDIDNVLLGELGKFKGFSTDSFLVKAAETNPEIKKAVVTRNEIETKNKTLNDVSEQVGKLQKSSDKNFNKIGDKQDESQKGSNLGLSIALGSLCLSIGLAVGLSLLMQGSTTHTQLDIFLLTNNSTELDPVKLNDYNEMRNGANTDMFVGSVTMVSLYVIGMLIMALKIKEKNK